MTLVNSEGLGQERRGEGGGLVCCD